MATAIMLAQLAWLIYADISIIVFLYFQVFFGISDDFANFP
jgi:hypothetical protein